MCMADTVTPRPRHRQASRFPADGAAARCGSPRGADRPASPAAGFITGQNIVVDGGMTRKMIYA